MSAQGQHISVVDFYSKQALTDRKMMLSKSNGYSMMPVVGTRTRSISCNVGR